MERWPLSAACMSAVRPTLFCRSTVAPRFSSSLTISRWPLAAAVCSRVEVEGRPLSPAGHLPQLASLGRVIDLEGQRGRAHRGLTSVWWGGTRGGGRLWGRCVLPDKLRDGRVACGLGPLQGGIADVVEQFSVGLCSQQGLHARLLPVLNGSYQGGAAIVALQVRVRRVLQEEIQDGEMPEVRSSHERCEAVVVWQVDARASLQQLPHQVQVAVGCGGVQQGVGCGLTICRVERLASHGRHIDSAGQRGRAHRGLTRSVWWGGRRCVLPEELRGGCVSLALGQLQRSIAVVVKQLNVGLGSQQGLHACLVPSTSGRHQGGHAFVALQVGVGRVLQEEIQDGEVAVVRSRNERGAAEAARQVDARASLQQLPHHLQLAVGRGGVQQGCGCRLAVSSSNRRERVNRPSRAQPLGHLPQLAVPGRVVHLEGQRGGRARRGLDGDWWSGRRGGTQRRPSLPEPLRVGWLLASDHLKEVVVVGLALEFGPLQSDAAFVVGRLSAGPG
eukprot:scaffold26128_cov71-Phaeocystis_antarctica.AAC.1